MFLFVVVYLCVVLCVGPYSVKSLMLYMGFCVQFNVIIYFVTKIFAFSPFVVFCFALVNKLSIFSEVNGICRFRFCSSNFFYRFCADQTFFCFICFL